jgi:photosystem II stability/assembly factor-like uncharacterized protein
VAKLKGWIGIALLVAVLGVGVARYGDRGAPAPVAQGREGAGGQAGEAETDSPDRAMRWRRLAWVDEHGNIPEGALARAIAQKQALASRAAPAMLANEWVEQGPTNVAGRSRCLVIHPTNPFTMWMGSAGGGIWKTTDGGYNWFPVGDRLASLAVSTLALDPNNPNVLYAGTGEGYFNIDAIGGYGIFKSTNGGDTWVQLSPTATWRHVNRVVSAPRIPTSSSRP